MESERIDSLMKRNDDRNWKDHWGERKKERERERKKGVFERRILDLFDSIRFEFPRISQNSKSSRNFQANFQLARAKVTMVEGEWSENDEIRQRALDGKRRRPQEIDPRSLVIPAREERCGAPIRAESRSNLAAGRRYRQSRVNGRRCITRSSLVRAANSIRSKSREIVGSKHARRRRFHGAR